jgi:hypothetical protein
MSFRVFMRATLQGVTQMGKSRPGATALRQHVQSLLQGGVGGPLLADGVFAREDDGRLCPAPTVTEADGDRCRCGRNCSAASVVRPEAVWRIASRWQRETNATTLRALR